MLYVYLEYVFSFSILNRNFYVCNITTIITRCLRSLVQVFDVRLSVEQIAFKRAVPLNLKGILICPVLAGGGGTLPGINRGVVYEKRTMQPLSVRQLSSRAYRIARSE